MGKVHPACAGLHPILSLLPCGCWRYGVQAQGPKIEGGSVDLAPGPAISLAGFLVTLYGWIEVTPRFSLTRLFMVWRGTPSTLAALVTVKPSGSRKSCRTMRPGCG